MTHTPAHNKPLEAPSLAAIRSPVEQDLLAIDELIATELTSTVPLIQEITQHIVQSGGKRLRPLLVILSARATGYQTGTEHWELATVVEFVHTATLLHDDVVDKSELRRGQQTANAIWDNQASVLVGDFLYSRAFQILARRNNIPVMKVLANATNQLSEGEVLQLVNQHNPEINETNYYDVIERKTAGLFSAASEIGAILGTQDTAQHHAMRQFGLHLGMAFQIIDDALDYISDAEHMGKNVGDDLGEGKTTLPLIYAIQQAPQDDADLLREAIRHHQADQIDHVLRILHDTKAFDYTYRAATKRIELARACLTELPNSPYREALEQLLAFVTRRNH